MNKILPILVFTLMLFVGFVVPTSSQEPTNTNSEAIDEAADAIKEQVAETVAELASEKMAYSGFILGIEDDQIDIELWGQTQTISYDRELTSVFDATNSFAEKTLDDLSVGDYVFVSGPEIDGVVTANAIYIEQSYQIISGKISQVNADSFSLEVLTIDKKTRTVDIETSTKQEILNIETLELSSTGFSKLKEGDSIHIVSKGSIDEEDEERISAVKTLVIPNEYFIQ